MANLVKDVLYLLRADSGCSVEEARGVLKGVISTIMDQRRLNFQEAVRVVKPLLPSGYRKDAIPTPWRKDFE